MGAARIHWGACARQQRAVSHALPTWSFVLVGGPCILYGAVVPCAWATFATSARPVHHSPDIHYDLLSTCYMSVYVYVCWQPPGLCASACLHSARHV